VRRKAAALVRPIHQDSRKPELAKSSILQKGLRTTEKRAIWVELESLLEFLTQPVDKLARLRLAEPSELALSSTALSHDFTAFHPNWFKIRAFHANPT
jgi:hypothetical protein